MKRTVLVIDDDKMILDMIQGILEDKFEVSAVNDGQKAFRVLERIHPDVILLDLKMPGMDGYDVISRLKVNQEYKGIPVIFLTSIQRQNDLKQERKTTSVNHLQRMH